MSTPDFPSSSPTSDGSPSGGLTDRLRDDGSTIAETAKHDLKDVTDKAAADIQALKDEAGQQASAMTEKAKSFAGEQKNLLAGQINGIADAVSQVAGQLENSDQGTVARYARDLAGGLSKFGKDVEGKDVDQLMGMAQSFGRQQPLAFLGAAALAGFVASRVAVASAHRSSTASSQGATAARQPQGTSSYGQPQSGTTYGQPQGSTSYRQEDE